MFVLPGGASRKSNGYVSGLGTYYNTVSYIQGSDQKMTYSEDLGGPICTTFMSLLLWCTALKQQVLR